jgi:predicted ribosome quality control (RQC) complex YloA/Tae2 family protein
MNRTVGVERTFSIGDFNFIKPQEYLTEIPEELASNSTFINKVRFIQLLNLELTYKKYLVLRAGIDKLSPEDAIAKLEELKANALDELNQILNKEE